MIRVAIADDHRLFADGLRQALDALPDMTIVAVAADAPGILALLHATPADVLILDLEMPGGGGSAVLADGTAPPTIVVTMHVTPETTAAVTALGTRGILSKAAPLADLAAAVRAVAAGHTVPVDTDERSALFGQFRKAALDPGAASLTDREIEVLQLLARGVSSTEELATRLYISQKTVKNHLASIFTKLSVSDRTQAATEAIRLGLARPK